MWVEFGHAKLARIVDLFQHNLGVVIAMLKLFDQPSDATFNAVVTEKHHKSLIAQKGLTNLDRVRQAERLLLWNVGDVHAPPTAVANSAANLVAGIANDNPDLGDARFADCVNDPEQHRTIGNRDELFGTGIGDWAQACAFAATENKTFHARCASLVWAVREPCPLLLRPTRIVP